MWNKNPKIGRFEPPAKPEGIKKENTSSSTYRFVLEHLGKLLSHLIR